RKLNRFFLYLFSLISWWDPFDYATSHTYHHRYTTHPEADRENVLPIQPSLHPWVLLRLFTIDLFTRPGRNFGKGGFFWAVYLTTRRAIGLSSGHQHIPSQEWLQSLHKDQPDSYRQSVLWSRFLILFHVCVLMYCIATGHWIWLAVITTASFTANGAAYFVGIPQHCGLRQNVNDFRKNTRSMKLNAVLEFLYWRMNWHTEHHMYSGVPCYNLKALAAEIADDMPPPRTLLGAWKEMRKIWHRQKIDPTYEFDTPVPTVAANSSEDNANSLVVSLGDLAPKSLR
ncbi:MAG: fatty acid desaturase, partial [Gammaproteobacteria bacterium]|nr:fatty acid desaturase [Gammaproteobacteria bacterium]